MLISMEFFIYLLGCCVQHLNTSVVVEGIFLMKLGSYQYVDIIGELRIISSDDESYKNGLSYEEWANTNIRLCSVTTHPEF
ncbi:hypothetical protein SCA6_019643 [Theobroma cacao]